MWTVKETTTEERNPFIVPEHSDFYKIVNGNEVDRNLYATTEQAQKRANALNNPEEDAYDVFVDEDTHDDYYGANMQQDNMTQTTELEEEIVLDGDYRKGQQITLSGIPYRIEATFFTTNEDIAMLEDLDIPPLPAGWHANARRIHE